MTWDAIRDRLTAAGVVRLYDVGKVPDRPAYPYAVLSVDTGNPRRRFGAGGRALTTRRASVQVWGRTTESVNDLLTKADVALDETYLTELDGAPVCRREISGVPVRDPDDDGVLYGLHTYRWDH